MLITRRRVLEGGSETSSSTGDTDVDSGESVDFDGEVDAKMAEVEKELKFERMKRELYELRAKNAAGDGAATFAKVGSPLVPAPTGAAPAAAAAAEQKPNKIKRGEIPGQKVKYKTKVSVYICARMLYVLYVRAVTLWAGT